MQKWLATWNCRYHWHIYCPLGSFTDFVVAGVSVAVFSRYWLHGPLIRYVKLRVAHAPGMFSPSPRVSDPDTHHGTRVTYVSWCMPGSLTSGFLSSRWWGKRFLHSRRMRNPQFYVSGKMSIPNIYHVNGLAGDCSNSNALAMEFLQSCSPPSMWDYT